MSPAGEGAHSRRARLAAGVLAAGLILLAAGVAGCGRRGLPQPMLKAPPVQVQAWQREGEALVSWRLPGETATETHGGLEGFRLLIERLTPRCPRCPPEEERIVRLEPGAPPLRVEAKWAFYGFAMPERPSLWRFQVATVYGRGTTPGSEAVLLEGPAEVPAHTLRWEWAGPAPAAGEPGRVRLYWDERRERVERVISEERTMVEREVFFRANLYRRLEGEPWPMRPVNGTPLQARQAVLAVAPPRKPEPEEEEESAPAREAEGNGARAAPASDAREEEKGAPASGPAATGETDVPAPEAWEFTLRLVDSFGNEGPAAPTVSIPIPGERP